MQFICRAYISLYCFCNIIHNSGEIEIVQQISRTLPNEIPTPEIIYANPCKGRGHIIDAVCRGVRLMTFDNVAEIYKCAEVSKKIQLIMKVVIALRLICRVWLCMQFSQRDITASVTDRSGI